MSAAPPVCVRIDRGTPAYPPSLERLGVDAPAALTAYGATALLHRPLLALLASVRAPGDAALAAYDLARLLRDAGVPVIGGFQSPLERECLDLMLAGAQPLVVCPAHGLPGMRPPAAWRAALEERRLLVLSAFPPRWRRPTATLAERRNRVVVALAERVLVLHASPGGRVHRLAAEALAGRKPVHCLDLPANRDLLVMGARPVDPATLLAATRDDAVAGSLLAVHPGRSAAGRGRPSRPA